MKKYKSETGRLHSKFTLICALIATTNVAVVAQGKPAQFKVGDRVEYVTGSGSEGGTITRGLEHNAYLVNLDRWGRPSAEGTPVVPEQLRLMSITPELVRAGSSSADRESSQPLGANSSSASFGIPTPAKQSVHGLFHPGDRVEIIVGSHWYPSTVLRGLEHNGYVVMQDRWANNQIVGPTTITPEEIRPLSGGAAPVQLNIRSKRAPMAEPAQSSAQAGPPPEVLIENMIRYLGESKSDNRYIVNIDVHKAQIGTPRPWVLYQDIGDGVPGKTLVYPVRSRWTERRYSDAGCTIQEREGVLGFYVNAFGKWQCGITSSKDVVPIQRNLKYRS